ncbi:hypothetical protein COZ60_04445 [Candidatus Bathyarchaeota archaeon CG_4_8_14_3_um_filter_42_8]|nr:MAG: hypothetical protein COZ60_04445 [Candidatus Bathyarchaeota archaeon CG_4_8_14_3_um_filter_42_8]
MHLCPESIFLLIAKAHFLLVLLQVLMFLHFEIGTILGPWFIAHSTFQSDINVAVAVGLDKSEHFY